MSRGSLLHLLLLACATLGTAVAEEGAAKLTRDWRHLAKCVASARNADASMHSCSCPHSTPLTWPPRHSCALPRSVLAIESPPPSTPPTPLSPGTGQGEGRWEDCTTCERCLTEDPPPVRAVVSFVSLAGSGSNKTAPCARVQTTRCLWLVTTKAVLTRCLHSPQGLTLTPGEKGHCTRCYGCSVVLERLPAHDVVLGRQRVVRRMACSCTSEEQQATPRKLDPEVTQSHGGPSTAAPPSPASSNTPPVPLLTQMAMFLRPHRCSRAPAGRLCCGAC